MVSSRSDSPGYSRLSKTELERFPIGYEDAWPVGPHLITTHDLSKGPDALLARITEPPSLLYVDPPWGGGNASTFRRKADVPGRADFPGLIRNLARVMLHCQCPTVMEMGVKWVDQVASILQSVGVPGDIPSVQGTYHRNKPMAYMVIQCGANAPVLLQALQGVDDEHSPGVVMDAMRLPSGALVFDPMCGRGLTAAHAVQRGYRFQGNELAPFRAAAAVAVLSEAT